MRFMWWVVDSRVGLEVPIVDSFDKLLRDLYDLLFASCREETNAPWGQCDCIACDSSPSSWSHSAPTLSCTELSSWQQLKTPSQTLTNIQSAGWTVQTHLRACYSLLVISLSSHLSHLHPRKKLWCFFFHELAVRACQQIYTPPPPFSPLKVLLSAQSSRCVVLYLHPSSVISALCMWSCLLSSSCYSCPSSLDEIYCVLLPSLPPNTERKA